MTHGFKVLLKGTDAGTYRDEQSAHAVLVKAWAKSGSARYTRVKRLFGSNLGHVAPGLGLMARAVMLAAACDGYRLVPVRVNAGEVSERTYEISA